MCTTHLLRLSAITSFFPFTRCTSDNRRWEL
nr:MAG TPA: hypothetical protein [Caudoviricetes sp.]